MVNLTLENDGFQRNKSSFFQAIGAPSVNGLRKHLEFAMERIEKYDWNDRPKPKPFRNLLFTPVVLSKNKDILKYVKDLKEEGVIDNVMFDSGGFQVLTGSLEAKGISNLDDLQRMNEEIYNTFDWADIYIMPDHPPNLLDTHHVEYKQKVDNTIEAATKFFDCLKPEVQTKVAPVFHLKRISDIEYMYNGYKPMLDKCKFASYSASSLTVPGSPRQLKGNSLVILDELQNFLSERNIDFHCLGIASPAAAFIVNYLGIRTYDASTPVLGAGFGKIYFPYSGGVSCSDIREDDKDNITQELLDELKEKTNHRCPFCEDLKALKRKSGGDEISGYLFRRMHNFCVLDDLNWHYSDLNLDTFKRLAPIQHKDLMTIRNDDQFSLF